MKILLAWLGMADVKASDDGDGLSGPIGQAVAADNYDKLVLLANLQKKVAEKYVGWLNRYSPISIEIISVKLSSPTNFRDIYKAASSALDTVSGTRKSRPDLTLHLSPGTPAMSAVWIILGRTKFPARLIQSSQEKGVEEADVPFEISAEFIPDFVRAADDKRRQVSSETAPENASFGDIKYKSYEMKQVVFEASKAALRNLPVLIEGESGTGKELLARAIHNNSSRKDAPFIVINCGAIPAQLVESEFFGHRKGSFSGAFSDQKGAFDAADGGTLFLDEVGEMPLAAQVTILRALQEGEVKPIGGIKAHKVDVRIIAATNKRLISEVTSGNFREDLYYRLAVATLGLPPLRDRGGDLGYLADKLLEQVNNDAAGEPGYIRKKFSPKAKNLILLHSWPGNIRELLNTLRRVTLFADGETISGEDMDRSIRPVATPLAVDDQILNRSIDEGIDLQDILKIVAKHYLDRAMERTGGNKRKAAVLVGLSSPQTLANWLNKYDV